MIQYNIAIGIGNLDFQNKNKLFFITYYVSVVSHIQHLCMSHVIFTLIIINIILHDLRVLSIGL